MAKNDLNIIYESTSWKGTVFLDFDEYFHKELILLTVLGIAEVHQLGFINTYYDSDSRRLYTDNVSEIFIKEMEKSFHVNYNYLHNIDQFNFKTRDEATAADNLQVMKIAGERFSNSDLCVLTYAPCSVKCVELSGLLKCLQQFLAIFEFPNQNDRFVLLIKERQMEGIKQAIDSSQVSFGKNTPIVSYHPNTDKAVSAWRLAKFCVCVKYGYVKKLVPEFNKLIPVPVVLIHSPDCSDVPEFAKSKH